MCIQCRYKPTSIRIKNRYWSATRTDTASRTGTTSLTNIKLRLIPILVSTRVWYWHKSDTDLHPAPAETCILYQFGTGSGTGTNLRPEPMLICVQYRFVPGTLINPCPELVPICFQNQYEFTSRTGINPCPEPVPIHVRYYPGLVQVRIPVRSASWFRFASQRLGTRFNWTSVTSNPPSSHSFCRRYQPRWGTTPGRRGVYWGPGRPAYLLDRNRDAISDPAVSPRRQLPAPQFPPEESESESFIIKHVSVLIMNYCNNNINTQQNGLLTDKRVLFLCSS